MARYFRFVVSDSNSKFKLEEVQKPVKNSNNKNRYEVTKISNIATGLVKPNLTPLTNRERNNTINNYTTSLSVDESYLKQFMKDKGKSYSMGSGYQMLQTLKSFANTFFDVDSVKYVKLNNNKDELRLYTHSKGEWSCKIERYTVLGQKSTKNWETNITSGSATLGDNYNIGSLLFTFSLHFSDKKIIGGTNFKVGSTYVGNNINERYCFYDEDNPEDNPNNKSSYVLFKVPYMYNANGAMQDMNHNGEQKHGNIVNGYDYDTIGTNESYSSNVLTKYKAKTKWVNDAAYSDASLSAVEKLAFGTKGEYVDGVAPMPYVMIELRGTKDADKSSKDNCFNLSIPANSFVSLSHERNMDDSYNTFSLQLFDKDAMQVEAKLVLGFRYITFWYTDFISTSKQFTGEVLDYKTVITGKGLMLTLSGYTTNISNYLGKDSIPWSVFGNVGSYEFYYWLNNAGEYHGEVMVTSEDGKNEIWNSSEGYVVKPHVVSMSEIGDYSLKVAVDQPDGSTKPEWKTFKEYYENYPDGRAKEDFEPHPKKWSLADYNSDIKLVLAGNQSFSFYDKRPSDIVKLICIINKWKYRESDIIKTRKVSEIPDQISMSSIEYIKEKLIPISVSEGATGSTQYYFWFDDDGCAHYGPVEYSNSGISLYFNSVDRKDSYPLISFTAATNGSAAMAVDRTQVIESINALTGDELSLSVVSGQTDDRSYNATFMRTSEWYSTNIHTVKDNDSLRLISYTDTSVVPSSEELKNMLINRWGKIAAVSYKAELSVWGCSDLSPGQRVNIHIYVDEGERSDADIYQKELIHEKTVVDSDGKSFSFSIDEPYYDKNVYEYGKGNITMHHTSGEYIINKITDTISAGKYISTLNVLKINKEQYIDAIEYNKEEDTETKSNVCDDRERDAIMAAKELEEFNSKLSSNPSDITYNEFTELQRRY